MALKLSPPQSMPCPMLSRTYMHSTFSISQNVGAFPLGWKKPEMPNAAKFKVSLL